jgi:bla regulator protein BlaR1
MKIQLYNLPTLQLYNLTTSNKTNITTKEMENTLYNISQVLGITIIHSLWQGLLIYFMLRLALMFSARISASKKYLFAVAGLLAITGWFIYTLINEIHLYNWLAITPSKLSAMPLLLELPSGIRQFNDQTVRYYYSIEEYLPYISIIYITGLLFNIARLILGRKRINAIRQTMSIDIILQRKVNLFREMLNIDQKVKIGLSKLVDVPCMTGYIKPVILLPITLSTYMTAEEIEAILLHELAHIKRNDYVVNLLQQVIATLLFFNPCAQLINRIINEERENCCDDLVIKSTPNPVVYAKALLKLEQTRENNMRMAMAATGEKYQLLSRIERIMKTKKPTQSIRPALLAMLILTIGIGCIAMLNPEIAQGKISIKSISPLISNLLSDTTHKTKAKKSQHLTSAHTNKKTYHSKDADGYDQSDENKKLNELSEEVQRHSEALSRYYNSDKFKALQQEMERRGNEMQASYNNPELKKMQEDMEKAGGDFSKNWGNNDKLTELSAKMGEIGRNVGAYFESPEFKKMNEALEKKYGIPHNHNYYNDNNEKDENYRKYQAELDSKLPPEIKRQTEQLKTMGEQLGARYETPEFKEQNQHLQALGDSLKRPMTILPLRNSRKQWKNWAGK